MGVQAIVMRNRRLTNELMSRMSPQTHRSKGEKYALQVARAAMERTRAYPDFLASTNGGLKRVATLEEFETLPVIDKRSYIDRYPLDELCLDGRFSHAYTIERSSGMTGGSYYWLRLPQEDAMFPQYLEHAFVQFYGMDTKSTLVLITLALGTWTSGEKMAQALREVAASGRYPLTVMAPGTDLDDIVEIVKDLAPQYDQVVIVGYPPFIKTVVSEGQRQGIDWKSFGVKLGLGGEGYSEQWREHMASIIGVDSNKDLLAISGGYGAADVGMSVGREYPITVMIRKLCMQDPDLADALFGGTPRQTGTLPSLCQYNPANCYIEEVDGELVFTVLSGIPLVRYNIHDRGGVRSFDSTMQILHDHGHDPQRRLEALGYGKEQVWRLPFFYVFGRTDGTVSIVGANIYPANIEAVLSEAGDEEIHTYRLSIETDAQYDDRLGISLEHRSADLSEKQMTEMVAEYHAMLVVGLRRVNRDFRDAYEDNPQSADPVVRVYARGTGPFKSDTGIKHHYV